jgi:hypothetical protein
MTKTRTATMLSGLLLVVAGTTFGIRKVTAYQIQSAKPRVPIEKLITASKALLEFTYTVRHLALNDKGVMVPVALETHSRRPGRYVDRVIAYGRDNSMNVDTRTGYDGENVFRVSDVKKLRSVYKDDGGGYAAMIINHTLSPTDCTTRIFDGHRGEAKVLGMEKIGDLATVKLDFASPLPTGGESHLYAWAAPLLACAAVKNESWDDGKLVTKMELVSWRAQDDATLYLIDPSYPNVAPSEQVGAKTRNWSPSKEETAQLKKKMANQDKVWAHHRIQ